MAVHQDFSLIKSEDGILSVSLVNPTSIGGWQLQFDAAKRFGGNPLLLKTSMSGYNGVSGVTITNSGTGMFQVAIQSVDTSGMNPGNLAYGITRLDSGSRTCLSEGYFILLPSVQG